ncbi:hypothetical protein [Marinobacter sp. OP 3.4]|uniref:hypothetical protein n=1 Tax=Marinobacter sp. OP 3.4 TaxID=3076501 RepID=UPI002E22E176
MSNDIEREAFEAFWRRTMNTGVFDLARTKYPMTRDEDQQYLCHETNRAWLTWQARAQASAGVVPEGWAVWKDADNHIRIDSPRDAHLCWKRDDNLADSHPMNMLADLGEAMLTAAPTAPAGGTPAARWRENGEPDPHGERYNGERASLCRGDVTDDELANEVYLYPHIGNLTAAKERIRWLSRKLVEVEALDIGAQRPGKDRGVSGG